MMLNVQVFMVQVTVEQSIAKYPTMHHNAFITHNEQYFTFGNTARQVPLLRHW